MFLFWIAHGVRSFRVDNPHTKPFAFWEWVIAAVKTPHPDVLFLAEAFTRPKAVRALAALGFSQSYTYFIWRTTAAELREYLTELTQGELAGDPAAAPSSRRPPTCCTRICRRADAPAFRVRLLLAATLSPLYGIYSGYELCEATPLQPGSEEYLDSEKFQLRQRDWSSARQPERRPRDRERPPPRAPRAAGRRQRRLPRFRSTTASSGTRSADTDPQETLLIAVNLDPHHAQETHGPRAARAHRNRRRGAVRGRGSSER